MWCGTVVGAGQARDRAVVGAGVNEDANFLILVSYAGLPGSWWRIGAEDLIEDKCLGGTK